MAKPEFFQDAFNQLAQNGCMATRRANSPMRTCVCPPPVRRKKVAAGLPRQVLHCHEAALQKGLRSPGEIVFADDHSGFEFRDRPDLSRLREEYRLPDHRATAIVMEYLDRLFAECGLAPGLSAGRNETVWAPDCLWKSFLTH